jgi:hypothetical protein
MIKSMSTNLNRVSTIVRTGRGLTSAETRTTIYEVMDYLKANWPVALIQYRMLLLTGNRN